MMDKINRQQAFHTKNRKKLSKNHELVVIAGNSFLQASGDQAFPFVQDSHFLYLTGVIEPESVLVIDRGQEYIIIPDRDVSRTAFEGPIDVDTIKQVSGITDVRTEQQAWFTLVERLKEVAAVATLLPAPSYMPRYEMFANPSRARLIERFQEVNQDIELVDLRSEITLHRMIKAPYELGLIKQAIKETVKLFKAIERVRGRAKNEADLAAEISRITIKNQLVNAYPPIIASGQNAITLHYVKDNAPLDKAGMLLLDIGLQYRGYCADISRTISFAPTQRQQAVFDAVLAVHSFALSILRPGIMMREYETQVQDAMAAQLINLGLISENSKEAVRRYYPHATSHFLGIDVHDVADYELPLKSGMVLTVEPGIYIADESIGIRLEDDVVITKDGVKILTDALPKSLSSLTIPA